MRLLVASLKGGSGKSTVSFNLAIWLAYRANVQVYDLDPQATLKDVCDERSDQHIFPTVFASPNFSETSVTADFIIVDSSFSAFSKLSDAIHRVDSILMPVGPSQADIWSAQRFVELCDELSAPPIWAFINRADTHHAVRESDEAEAALQQLPRIKPMGVRLGQRTAFRRSLSESKAVFELESRSKASQELEVLATALFPNVAHASF